MKKGQIYEGTAIDVGFPDKAVVLTKETDKNGIVNECYVEVKGVLPGQTVKYIVKKARAGKCKGRLLEITRRSPYETAKPGCVNFGVCGGCSYQTLPYHVQLELKKNQVLKLLNSVLEEGSYKFDGIFKSPCIWGYRNKMEFSFGDEYKGGPLSLGLHKKGSIYDVINASGCKIVNNDYSKVLDCIKEYFLNKNIPHYNKNTHTGILRHLLVRRSSSTGEMLVALVTASGQGHDIDGHLLEKLGEKLQSLELGGSITGFIHIINDGLGDVVKSDETHIIFGRDWITEEILGLKFRISMFSFFQTNTKGAEVLYSCARNYILGKPAYGIEEKESINTNIEECGGKKEYIDNEEDGKEKNIRDTEERREEKELRDTGECIKEKETRNTRECIKEMNIKETKEKTWLEDKVVFDLYSGTGTIAQIIAPVAKKVTGVEIVEEAVYAARQNAEYNGLGNCEFIAGDVLEVLDRINEKPDFIILDPPREGVNPKALKKICGEMEVPGMVYISCKPTSLARDIVELQKYGYKVERVCCVDMFPQTGHVETVALLSQQQVDDYVKVSLDLEDKDLTAVESKATYTEIKDYVFNKFGLKVSALYIAQTKKKYGVEMGKNYNVSKKHTRVPNCPSEKEEAIVDALRYYRMIV